MVEILIVVWNEFREGLDEGKLGERKGLCW